MSSGHSGRFDGVFGEGDSHDRPLTRSACRIAPLLAGLFGSRCALVKDSDRKAPTPTPAIDAGEAGASGLHSPRR